MANWLEDEELKREAEDRQRRAKEAAETATLAQLTQFHALCARVNRVRHGALSVHGLRTYALPRWNELSGSSRGLTIATDGQESVFIDADKESEKGPREILVRTACSIGELGRWAEPCMLQCIKWLLCETNDVHNSLPGREILNGESEIFIEYDKRYHTGDPDKVGVLLDGTKLGWGFVGSDTGRFRISPGRHELTVTGSDSSASVQIDAPPYGVLFYRAFFHQVFLRFRSRLSLVPRSPEGSHISRPRLSQ